MHLNSFVLTPEVALRKAIQDYMSSRPELERQTRDARSVQEAAETLQADLLAKQAQAAGAQARLQAQLMDASARLFALRGKSPDQVHDALSDIAMELSAMAAALGSDPSERKQNKKEEPVSSSSPSCSGARKVPTSCTGTFHGHEQSVICLAFAGGSNIASGSVDHTIKIWDVQSGRCESTLTGHGDCVCCLAFLGGTTIASGSYDHKIKTWS